MQNWYIYSYDDFSTATRAVNKKIIFRVFRGSTKEMTVSGNYKNRGGVVIG
jgi:hypothetical protein